MTGVWSRVAFKTYKNGRGRDVARIPLQHTVRARHASDDSLFGPSSFFPDPVEQKRRQQQREKRISTISSVCVCVPSGLSFFARVPPSAMSSSATSTPATPTAAAAAIVVLTLLARPVVRASPFGSRLPAAVTPDVVVVPHSGLDRNATAVRTDYASRQYGT